MKGNFPLALQKLLRHEGGYVDHKDDPGGMTNLGITKRTWELWTKAPATEATMRSLTPEMAAPLYKAMFWDKMRCDELPDGLDYMVFDAAVNSGPARAAKWLQKCLRIKPTGVLNAAAIAAAQSADLSALLNAYTAERLRFLQGLRTWPVFGRGWNRRVAEVSTAAKTMGTQA